MSQEAIDLARAAFEQFARGDFSAVADLPDEFELVLAPEMPDAGTYRGPEARRWIAAWVDSFDRLTQEPVEIIDAGDNRVLTRVHPARLDRRERCTGGASYVVACDRA